MSDCNSNCSSCGSKTCSSRKAIEKAPLAAGSSVKKVIAVMSGKGGVGKSLVTGLLAVLSRRMGYSTAVLDADITGPSVPRMFGINGKAVANDAGILPGESKTGIKAMSINMLLERDTDPVVWRGPVIGGAIKQFWSEVLWGDIDVMFIDMPPGTGDVALTVFQSLPVDGVVIVSTPQSLVDMIVRKAVKMAGMLNVPVMALVENMSYALCPDCGKEFPLLGESHVEENAREMEIPHTARIPFNMKLAAACDKGMIELFDGEWLDKVAKELLKDLPSA